jgi:hypothetical protein
VVALLISLLLFITTQHNTAQVLASSSSWFHSAHQRVMQENTLVTPGQRLGRVGEFVAGPGTYETDRHIVASLVGRKIVFPQADV